VERLIERGDYADRHSLDGLRSIQVLEAIHQAAQTGDPV